MCSGDRCLAVTGWSPGQEIQTQIRKPGVLPSRAVGPWRGGRACQPPARLAGIVPEARQSDAQAPTALREGSLFGAPLGQEWGRLGSPSQHQLLTFPSVYLSSSLQGPPTCCTRKAAAALVFLGASFRFVQPCRLREAGRAAVFDPRLHVAGLAGPRGSVQPVAEIWPDQNISEAQG